MTSVGGSYERWRDMCNDSMLHVITLCRCPYSPIRDVWARRWSVQWLYVTCNDSMQVPVFPCQRRVSETWTCAMTRMRSVTAVYVSVDLAIDQKTALAVTCFTSINTSIASPVKVPVWLVVSYRIRCRLLSLYSRLCKVLDYFINTICSLFY